MSLPQNIADRVRTNTAGKCTRQTRHNAKMHRSCSSRRKYMLDGHPVSVDFTEHYGCRKNHQGEKSLRSRGRMLRGGFLHFLLDETFRGSALRGRNPDEDVPPLAHATALDAM